MTDVTISELHEVLSELIKNGHGNKEFQLYYDSEMVYTTIPRNSEIRINKEGVRFSDYRR